MVYTINRKDNKRCKNFYFLEQLPACLHRTTQNKKLKHGAESYIVSKKGTTLGDYIAENTRSISKYSNSFERAVEEKSVNLLLTQKSYSQKEKVLGMFAALGFDATIEKMKNAYVGVDKDRFMDYIEYIVRDAESLVVVYVSDCGLVYNSQEEVEAITPIAGRLPQELTSEQLAQKSKSWQKGWNAFGGRVIDKGDEVVKSESAILANSADLTQSAEKKHSEIQKVDDGVLQRHSEIPKDGALQHPKASTLLPKPPSKRIETEV